MKKVSNGEAFKFLKFKGATLKNWS